MNRIIFDNAALIDFKAAIEYYDDIDKKLDEKLYSRLWQTLEYIKEHRTSVAFFQMASRHPNCSNSDFSL